MTENTQKDGGRNRGMDEETVHDPDSYNPNSEIRDILWWVSEQGRLNEGEEREIGLEDGTVGWQQGYTCCIRGERGIGNRLYIPSKKQRLSVDGPLGLASVMLLVEVAIVGIPERIVLLEPLNPLSVESPVEIIAEYHPNPLAFPEADEDGTIVSNIGNQNVDEPKDSARVVGLDEMEKYAREFSPDNQ